jgi:hypothetical protein
MTARIIVLVCLLLGGAGFLVLSHRINSDPPVHRYKRATKTETNYPSTLEIQRAIKAYCQANNCRGGK